MNNNFLKVRLQKGSHLRSLYLVTSMQHLVRTIQQKELKNIPGKLKSLVMEACNGKSGGRHENFDL